MWYMRIVEVKDFCPTTIFYIHFRT